MRVSLDQILNSAKRIIPELEMGARNYTWLEACGYPGIAAAGGPGR